MNVVKIFLLIFSIILFGCGKEEMPKGKARIELLKGFAPIITDINCGTMIYAVRVDANDEVLEQNAFHVTPGTLSLTKDFTAGTWHFFGLGFVSNIGCDMDRQLNDSYDDGGSKNCAVGVDNPYNIDVATTTEVNLSFNKNNCVNDYFGAPGHIATGTDTGAYKSNNATGSISDIERESFSNDVVYNDVHVLTGTNIGVHSNLMIVSCTAAGFAAEPPNSPDGACKTNYPGHTVHRLVLVPYENYDPSVPSTFTPTSTMPMSKCTYNDNLGSDGIPDYAGYMTWINTALPLGNYLNNIFNPFVVFIWAYSDLTTCQNNPENYDQEYVFMNGIPNEPDGTCIKVDELGGPYYKIWLNAECPGGTSPPAQD